MEAVTIIGAGLAGSEAAWQLAMRGVPVRLVEMRPVVRSPAHMTDQFAELVCSNSIKSDDPDTAPGLLKRELEDLGSLVMATARACAVPAGSALAVDRDAFAAAVTSAVCAHPLVTIFREEAVSLPEGDVIVAAGPLATDAIASALSALTRSDRLAFYDAAAPIVDAQSIDAERTFKASRWHKGAGADYVNCPMDQQQYDRFVDALVSAQRVKPKQFERRDLFQACQPIEEVARTGRDALRYGALKPVGLIDPASGKPPWAVVQLRAENRAATAYNLVGFQTNLTFAEQERVFRMIPGLERAVFFRYGVMHRNTFIDAPRLLGKDLALRTHPHVRVAGQLMGTEGYLEAAGTGLLAALNVVARREGRPPFVLPRTTALGSLVAYATDPATIDYQPMHVNFGLVPPLDTRVSGKRARFSAYARRARSDMASYLRTRSDVLFMPDPIEAPPLSGPERTPA